MSVFGFSTEASAGNADIVPVVKYDARSGRMFRNDRMDTGSGFVSEQVDVSRTFKALFDLENVETGWILFAAGVQPHFALVPIGTALPLRPTPDHKNGIRFMCKLGKECGGDVREMAGTSKVFMAGVERLYIEYLAQREANPGKLPVVELADTLPVKSGQSTNYQPVFKIVAWAPRGDLVFKPKGTSFAGQAAAPASTPPNTGATRVPPPVQRTPEPAGADADFG